ncbi:MAG: hypothetical protein ACRECH_13745 [Nitrososphaerales archaeon]
MQQLDSEAWEIISLLGSPRTIYHWNCLRIRITAEEVEHNTEVRISELDGIYKIFVSKKVAGAELFRDGWTLEMLNRFLVKLGFPELPTQS